MPIAKAFGFEIKEFYENHFPEGYYIDDCEIETHDEDGKWLLEPDKKYDLGLLGSLYLESQPVGSHWYNNSMTFRSAFTKWKKASMISTVLISFPKDKEEEVIAALNVIAGVKIVK